MVAPLIIGAGISAGASLGGGLLAQDAAKDQARANRKAQQKMDKQNRQFTRKENQIAREREDNKIQRLVADANAAGIHPLAALGSSVAGNFAQPVPYQGTAYQDTSDTGAMGNALAAAGSTIGQAVMNMELQRAQINNLNASSANQLAEAQAHSRAQAIRNGAVSGSNAAHEIGVFDMTAKKPGAAQRAQDDFGDIWEQIIGTFNIDELTVNYERLGPLGKILYSIFTQYGVPAGTYSKILPKKR